MKKNLLLFILLLQLPVTLRSAAAADDELPDPYADSQIVAIVGHYSKQDVPTFLFELQEEISEFLRSEEINRALQRKEAYSQRERTRNFMYRKIESRRLNPNTTLTRPFEKSAEIPLQRELLKNELYKKRKATLARIKLILDTYNATQQLLVPLELLSEALEGDEKNMASILQEERDFLNLLALPINPSSGLVDVPIPPLSADTPQ